MFIIICDLHLKTVASWKYFWLQNALFFLFSSHATAQTTFVEEKAHHLGLAQLAHRPPQSLESPLAIIS